MEQFRKPLYMAAGFLALLLGAIGVVLPLLPTTPFVLLAAFFFSRGSRKIHHWLLNQRTFGPMIRDWENNRIIPLKAKLISTSMMLLMVSYPLLFRPFALWLKVFVVFTVFYALWYVWRHRSVPLDQLADQAWQQMYSARPNGSAPVGNRSAHTAVKRREPRLYSAPKSNTSEAPLARGELLPVRVISG